MRAASPRGGTAQLPAVVVPFPAAPALREDELVRLWEGQRFPREALRTRQGEALQVVHRGRRNLGAGPDFLRRHHRRRARAAAKGRRRAARPRQRLRGHGHHLDPRYDNVVLHVVFHDDAGEPTLLRCGRRVAVVALAPWVARRAEQLRLWLAQPVLLDRALPERRRLRRLAGGRRDAQPPGSDAFPAEASALRGRCVARAPTRPSTKAYCGPSATAATRRRFARLAHLLPYERLRQALDRGGLVAAEALLLGSGGLLPGQRGLGGGVPLRAGTRKALGRGARRTALRAARVWATSAACDRTTTRRGGWPVWPACSIAGRALSPGLRSLEEADPDGPCRGSLAAWQVPADGFWQSHHDLDGRRAPPFGALIGRGRALEVLVNAVLPFAAAFGETRGLDALSQRALALFLRLPSRRLLRRHPLPGERAPSSRGGTTCRAPAASRGGSTSTTTTAPPGSAPSAPLPGPART